LLCCTNVVISASMLHRTWIGASIFVPGVGVLVNQSWNEKKVEVLRIFWTRGLLVIPGNPRIPLRQSSSSPFKVLPFGGVRMVAMSQVIRILTGDSFPNFPITCCIAICAQFWLRVLLNCSDFRLGTGTVVCIRQSPRNVTPNKSVHFHK
jgi:hypothetical protein